MLFFDKDLLCSAPSRSLCSIVKNTLSGSPQHAHLPPYASITLFLKFRRVFLAYSLCLSGFKSYCCFWFLVLCFFQHSGHRFLRLVFRIVPHLSMHSLVSPRPGRTYPILSVRNPHLHSNHVSNQPYVQGIISQHRPRYSVPDTEQHQDLAS